MTADRMFSHILSIAIGEFSLYHCFMDFSSCKLFNRLYHSGNITKFYVIGIDASYPRTFTHSVIA